jgi:hypothetical protein
MQRAFGTVPWRFCRACAGTTACWFARDLCPVSPAIRASRVVRPLEGDETLLHRERLPEEDGPHIAQACNGASWQKLKGIYPAVLTADPAQQREIRLPHHRHGPNLDRVLVSHGTPLWSPRRTHVARGEIPCLRRAAGLRTGSQRSVVSIGSLVKRRGSRGQSLRRATCGTGRLHSSHVGSQRHW